MRGQHHSITFGPSTTVHQGPSNSCVSRVSGTLFANGLVALRLAEMVVTGYWQCNRSCGQAVGALPAISATMLDSRVERAGLTLN
jgi:hypothetical protein